MSKNTPITVARGDGIGPEIMEATLAILKGGGARLDIEEIEIGEKVYLRGNPAGIEPSAWESLRRTKVFLKAPITTPQGGGFKSLNVTTRKAFGLYANIRPCLSYDPYIRTKHPKMDVVIVRENEEDTYSGIEHRRTYDVTQCLKLISRPGCEKIVRYAFEYARAYGRKKVTCFTKDNIMKMTDGLFHKVFDEIGAEYADIEKEHWIVDIGAAKLADTPEVLIDARNLPEGSTQQTEAPLRAPDALKLQPGQVVFTPDRVKVQFTVAGRSRSATLPTVRVEIAGAPEDLEGFDVGFPEKGDVLRDVVLTAPGGALEGVEDGSIRVVAIVHLSQEDLARRVPQKPVSAWVLPPGVSVESVSGKAPGSVSVPLKIAPRLAPEDSKPPAEGAAPAPAPAGG